MSLGNFIFAFRSARISHRRRRSDNRLKTLFDALRVPRNVNELPSGAEPKDSEVPFRCLLEDDSLITGHAVTTDRLLLPAANDNHVRLILRVHIEPMIRGTGNLAF